MMSEGKPAVALPQFRAVLRECANDAQAHCELGRCLAVLERRDAAIASLREALHLLPDWPEAVNEFAWLLAAAPEDDLREGAGAARLAEATTKLALRREPLLLDTLAAHRPKKGISNRLFERSNKHSSRRPRLAKISCELNSRSTWLNTSRSNRIVRHRSLTRSPNRNGR
jgi:tetratricopeptide (TPR) repeat protein